jgi:hypothetical protein
MRSKRTNDAVQTSDRVLARYAQDIKKLLRRTGDDVCQIGKLLIAARKRMPHGSWLPWLEKELEWSSDTAERFINVYQNFAGPKFRKLRNLANPALLYELAKPTLPEAARAEIIEQIEAGEPVKVADVKRIRVPMHEPVAVPCYPHPEEEREPVVLPAYQEPEAPVDTPVPNPVRPSADLADVDADFLPEQPGANSGDPIAACLAEVVPIMRAAIVKMDAEKRLVFSAELRKAIRTIMTEVTAQDAETDRWEETTHLDNEAQQ